MIIITGIITVPSLTFAPLGLLWALRVGFAMLIITVSTFGFANSAVVLIIVYTAEGLHRHWTITVPSLCHHCAITVPSLCHRCAIAVLLIPTFVTVI